ncbi:MAG: dihydrofolate reductase [Flavobacteriaceae bacterium]|nr:dihydrofolate reductase [Flavobacteriaceae bacterium]
MRKIKLYIAISLNGKIARTDGSVDWLESMPNPDQTDHGFGKFYSSIDTTLQGYNTYKVLLDRGIEIPSKDKINFVLTRKQHVTNTKFITFITEKHLHFVEDLKEKEGKDIWLIGGGQVNTMLFNANLIDEMRVFVMPIIIPEGISLFESIPKESRLKLIGSKTYSSGAVELNYKII